MGQTIGQLFHGNLTQPGSALIDPQSGQPTYIGGPQQVLAQFKQSLRPQFTDPMDPAQSMEIPSNIPIPGRPSFPEAAGYGALPGSANVMSPGLSKGGKLLALLSSGLQGALAGRAAQEQAVIESGGHRAGGAGLGFEAGMAAPFQRAQEIQQTELGQAGLTPVETPVGPMPAAFATKSLLPWMVRGQTAENVANINAGSRQQTAQIGAGAKTQSAQIAANATLQAKALEAEIAAGTVSKFVPDVDPQTGQQFYRTFNKFGKEMQPVDVSVIPALMAHTSSTVDYQQDASGNIVALPKTTVTRPVVPGRSLPNAAAATGGAGVNATPVLEGGKPMQGKGSAKENAQWVYWQDPSGRTVAGPLSMARQAGAQNPALIPTEEVRSINDARQAVNLIEAQGRGGKPATWGVDKLIDSLNKDGKLGVVSSRLSSWLSGGVGAEPGDDPRIMALLDKSQLAMTLVMKAHFGVSGGRSPQMLDHFLSMANAKKMNANTLRAGFAAVDSYMRDRAMVPGQQANTSANGGQRPPLSSFEH